ESESQVITGIPASIAALIGSTQPSGSLQDTPIASTPCEIASSTTRACSAMSEFTEPMYRHSTSMPYWALAASAAAIQPSRPSSNTGLLSALGIQATVNVPSSTG